jgi:hypothetical protein
MAEMKTGDPVQFLDLLLEHFADETGWLRGDLDDGRGGRCLVGAIHYLRCRHQIPSRAAESLLQEALPQGFCHLALFNDGCADVAELRALIMNARLLAFAKAEPLRERAAQDRRRRVLTWFERARPPASDECPTDERERLAA